uniref:Uncharacterized protein n=1 Tax=Arundo donax TaxID=35708 RepID=A0A0A8YGJ7_ARUDO
MPNTHIKFANTSTEAPSAGGSKIHSPGISEIARTLAPALREPV